jgi:hypothetical protein
LYLEEGDEGDASFSCFVKRLTNGLDILKMCLLPSPSTPDQRKSIKSSHVLVIGKKLCLSRVF